MSTVHERFRIEFEKIIENEVEFKKHWNGVIRPNVLPTMRPFIDGTKYLSPKGKDAYESLVNQLKGWR